jgi:hypothetical protein
MLALLRLGTLVLFGSGSVEYLASWTVFYRHFTTWPYLHFVHWGPHTYTQVLARSEMSHTSLVHIREKVLTVHTPASENSACHPPHST